MLLAVAFEHFFPCKTVRDSMRPTTTSCAVSWIPRSQCANVVQYKPTFTANTQAFMKGVFRVPEMCWFLE